MGELDQYLVRAIDCGNCIQNIRNCPWLHSGRPVPGWEATPRKYEVHPGKFVTSYFIQSCPLYIPAPERNSDPAELTPNQNEWFLRGKKHDG